MQLNLINLKWWEPQDFLQIILVQILEINTFWKCSEVLSKIIVWSHFFHWSKDSEWNDCLSIRIKNDKQHEIKSHCPFCWKQNLHIYLKLLTECKMESKRKITIVLLTNKFNNKKAEEKWLTKAASGNLYQAANQAVFNQIRSIMFLLNSILHFQFPLSLFTVCKFPGEHSTIHFQMLFLL